MNFIPWPDLATMGAGAAAFGGGLLLCKGLLPSFSLFFPRTAGSWIRCTESLPPAHLYASRPLMGIKKTSTGYSICAAEYEGNDKWAAMTVTRRGRFRRQVTLSIHAMRRPELVEFFRAGGYGFLPQDERSNTLWERHFG